MTDVSSALGLRWLPQLADIRGRLRALGKLTSPSGESWAETVLLANARLDFTQTNGLDQIARALFVKAPPEGLAAGHVRLAILGSSTLSHVHAGIRVGGLRRRLFVSTYEHEYGQYQQELRDPDSGLHRFQPNFILFAFDSRHVTAQVHSGLGVAEADAELEKICGSLTECWSLAHTKFHCVVLQQTIIPNLPGLLGSNEHRLAGSPAGFINRLNLRLRDLAQSHGVDLVAIDQRVIQDGLSAWHAPALWHRSKQEVTPAGAPFYGDLVARLIAARLGRSAKCLVMDLDNTIWGGVIGDDGVDGIVLGQGSALGEAFASVQDYALNLSRRGIILAVCSKNDPANALEPFQNHPEMILRREHIASFVANWDDKATNLRAIAAELNLGLDALVFLDDNPFERALVRRELPAVAVPEVPEDPALVPQWLADTGYFESVTITGEDKQRSRQYQQNRAHKEMQASATDLGSYLEGLEMQLIWRPIDLTGLPRTVQLINKTNQFNLTTRRYSEDDIRRMIQDPDWHGLQLRLLDRFGDNGMIAIVICNAKDGGDMHIDSWLMSCRVLGRQVEHATLNVLVGEARRFGSWRLIGEFRPTNKNSMVKDHYTKLGFAPGEVDADGNCLGFLDISAFTPIETFIRTMEGGANDGE